MNQISNLFDDRDEKAADEEAEGEGGEEEASAHGLHALGRLGDEEVKLSGVNEGLAGADDKELRN